MADRKLLSMRGVVSVTLAVTFMFVATTLAAAPKLIGSPEADWPQWRGPMRNSISSETGLLDSWPTGGPKLLWKAAGMGRGWCSPIIAEGKIFIVLLD